MPRPRVLWQACTELLYLPICKDQHIKDISARAHKYIQIDCVLDIPMYTYRQACTQLPHIHHIKNNDDQRALCRFQSYHNPGGVYYPPLTPLHYNHRPPRTPRPLLVPLPPPHPNPSPLLQLATRGEWNELFFSYFGILCLPVPQGPGVGGWVGGGRGLRRVSVRE